MRQIFLPILTLCLAFPFFLQLQAQGRYYKYDEDLRLGACFSDISSHPKADFLLNVEYDRIFLEPVFVVIHLSYANEEGKHLPGLDLGLYYGLIKSFEHDLRLGGLLAARLFPLEDAASREDDFEIIPGLMPALLYEYSFHEKWALGGRVFAQFFEDGRRVLAGGLHICRRF